MSNSRALASNQRPNKTTRRLLAGFLHPCLRCFTSRFLRWNSSSPSTLSRLFSRVPQTSFFPQVSLAFSTLTTIRRQRLRRLTSPRRTLHRAGCAGKRILHPSSYLIPLISARAFARASAVLLRVSHLCQMEIARERDLPAAMLTKYSRILPAIVGLSASMCIFT